MQQIIMAVIKWLRWMVRIPFEAVFNVFLRWLTKIGQNGLKLTGDNLCNPNFLFNFEFLYIVLISWIKILAVLCLLEVYKIISIIRYINIKRHGVYLWLVCIRSNLLKHNDGITTKNNAEKLKSVWKNYWHASISEIFKFSEKNVA